MTIEQIADKDFRVELSVMSAQDKTAIINRCDEEKK